ncbi:MAG: bifunctional phosphoribosyl-AMP cyclohydrolase/phosphoribosyl-ATP diphosphatase HisIE [Clostridiales bacterium]|jgi:phosphoribosyl-ATP pyrophosphohydrolase/phosphoribosyl-AMP cyclohydrolase|nr:bifunctional phosphoribosyl-AMP cyclohydrolase/phosphoribosyl-ATP diphosphatase HisIE [Clostridiales bacterium]
MNPSDVKFDAHGLAPVVIQDYYSGDVLTLAYMNAESLGITIREKRVCLYSRSRKTLWRKGETSGNVQRVVNIKADCDGDALVVQVIKDGPACHTGAESCFFNWIFGEDERFTIGALYKVIEERKNSNAEDSYTKYLFEKGIEKILKKVGEESAEVIIAAMKRNNDETVYEIADLCYHTLVLMSERGIAPSDVTTELARRHIKRAK